MNSKKNRFFRCTGSAILLGFLGCAPWLQANLPLDSAVFSEVINEVRITDSWDLEPVQVSVMDPFRTPQILLTGRRSRAQLEAADGTVTRVGSNTVFSFSENSRDVYLQRGSLFFNAPAGKGGGRIVTAAAVASVIGTSLMVSATSEGGYKLLVLEGKARVTFNDGQQLDLNAGQMTMVLPGQKPLRALPGASSGGDAESSSREESPGGQPAAVTAPAPVLTFDVATVAATSGLLNGFSAPPPSAPLVDSVIQQQSGLKTTGRLAPVVIVETPTTVEVKPDEPQEPTPEPPEDPVPPPQEPEQPPPPVNEELSHAQDLQRLIRSGVFTVDPAKSTFLAGFSEGFTGLYADALRISARNMDLGDLDVTGNRFDFVVAGAMEFTGDLEIAGMSRFANVRFIARSFSFGEGMVWFDYGDSPVDGSVAFIAQQSVALQDVTFRTRRDVILDSREGSLTMDGTRFEVAQLQIGSSDTTKVEVSNSQVVFQGANLAKVATHVTAEDWIALHAVRFAAVPGFSGLDSVSLSARTIALSDVNFNPGSRVHLSSERGRLADQPNTGAQVLPGFVNFIRNVTYGGEPAQHFVPVSVGGTGPENSPIRITPRPGN